jgi:rhamnogalacturonyl hydrolase YesR
LGTWIARLLEVIIIFDHNIFPVYTIIDVLMKTNRSLMALLILGMAIQSFISARAQKLSENDAFSRKAIKTILKKVADYQVQTPLTHTGADWTNGALFAGMTEWAKVAGDEQYFNWLKEMGDKNNWTYNHRDDPGGRYHADDYCVGQMYLELYRKYKDPKMIDPMREYFAQILQDPPTGGLEFTFTDNYWPTERWSWCDALFMGPTVWAKMAGITGEMKYLDFMFHEYKATTDYLYSNEDHLFFRDSRFFTRKEANGEKIFWGRGNGWVFAGLPIILRELPSEYRQKAFFEQIYKEMGAKILSIQDAKGYWHASLLDPESYPNPEISATGFFVYGLAWGINHGYFDREAYLPAVKKGWKAMTDAVWPDGKVGWIQPIGEDPKAVTRDMTEVYGVGAFLLAGTEMLQLVK